MCLMIIFLKTFKIAKLKCCARNDCIEEPVCMMHTMPNLNFFPQNSIHYCQLYVNVNGRFHVFSRVFVFFHPKSAMCCNI